MREDVFGQILRKRAENKASIKARGRLLVLSILNHAIDVYSVCDTGGSEETHVFTLLKIHHHSYIILKHIFLGSSSLNDLYSKPSFTEVGL